MLPEQQQDAIAKFRELVKDVNTCMFTTIDEDQQISSRPMFTSRIDDEGNVWFFTNEFSEKIREVSKDNIVNLIYSHPGKNLYANVRGTSSLIIDRKKNGRTLGPGVKGMVSRRPGRSQDLPYKSFNRIRILLAPQHQQNEIAFSFDPLCN